MTQENLYRIGAISKLTGIPTVTIRMWERRYNVVEPRRTEAGGRLYTPNDLRRLGLLKQAVDAGHAISTIAGLSDKAIQQRLSQKAEEPATSNQAMRICIIGEYLNLSLQASDEDNEAIDIVSRFNNFEAFSEQSQSDHKVDVVVLAEDVVTAQTAERAATARRRLNALSALVVYKFGTKAHVQQLETSQLRSVRAPLTLNQLARACTGTIGLPTTATSETTEELQQLLFQPLPSKRFSVNELAKLSQQTDVVKCECPQHLSDLIQSLSAFEQYSEQCESQNREDAAMHMLLHVTTAKARRLLEDALEHLVQTEGIETA